MAIVTVEQALAQMAEELKGPRMTALARHALGQKGDLQVLLTVRSANQGAVVSMEARDCIVKKFGTYIRLK